MNHLPEPFKRSLTERDEKHKHVFNHVDLVIPIVWLISSKRNSKTWIEVHSYKIKWNLYLAFLDQRHQQGALWGVLPHRHSGKTQKRKKMSMAHLPGKLTNL